MSKSAIFDGKPVNISKFKDNQQGTIPLPSSIIHHPSSIKQQPVNQQSARTWGASEAKHHAVNA